MAKVKRRYEFFLPNREPVCARRVEGTARSSLDDKTLAFSTLPGARVWKDEGGSARVFSLDMTEVEQDIRDIDRRELLGADKMYPEQTMAGKAHVLSY